MFNYTGKQPWDNLLWDIVRSYIAFRRGMVLKSIFNVKSFCFCGFSNKRFTDFFYIHTNVKIQPPSLGDAPTQVQPFWKNELWYENKDILLFQGMSLTNLNLHNLEMIAHKFISLQNVNPWIYLPCTRTTEAHVVYILSILC